MLSDTSTSVVRCLPAQPALPTSPGPSGASLRLPARRRRQALRTNLRRAEFAGIRAKRSPTLGRAFDEITEIVDQDARPLTPSELPILATWQAVLERPEMTLLVARDRLGCPLAVIGAVIDDSVCVIWVAVASSHEARWALHDHRVRILIARGVNYLLGEGGGRLEHWVSTPIFATTSNLLGYELRHLRSTRRGQATAEDTPSPARDVTPVSGSRQLSPVSAHVGSAEKRSLSLPRLELGPCGAVPRGGSGVESRRSPRHFHRQPGGVLSKTESQTPRKPEAREPTSPRPPRPVPPVVLAQPAARTVADLVPRHAAGRRRSP